MPANVTYTDLLDEAQKFIDDQQYSSAIDIYEKALLIEPNNKTVLYNLGWTYNMTGNPDKAKDYYQKAITIDDSYFEAYNDLGILYLDELHDYDKAIEQFQLALKHNGKTDSRNKFALYNLARAFLKKGDTQKAIEYYEKRISADPSDLSDIYNEMGNVYSDYLKDYPKAIEKYQLSIQSDSKNYIALYNIGRVYSITKDFEKALIFYQKSIDVEKTYANAYNGMGIVYEGQDLLDKAIQYYELAVKYNPVDKNALYNLARAYLRNGETKKAIEFYNRRISADPSDLSDIYNELGNIYGNELKDYDKAIEQYLLSIQHDPKNHIALYNLGRIYGLKNEFDKAIKSYQEAISIDKTYANGYNGIGAVYDDQNLPDKAIEYYELALTYNPKHKSALQNLAASFLNKGDVQKAIEYYKRRIDADPSGLPEIYNELGNIYSDKLKNNDEAIKQYNLALNANANYSYALYNLGRVYKIKKDWNNAILYYNKAIVAGYEPAETYRVLGDVYFEKKDYDVALTQYDLCLQKEPNNYYSLVNSAKCWEQKGDDVQAMQFYQRAINGDKSFEADAYNEVGNFYYNKKKYDDAIKNYELSLNIKNDNKYALHNLGLTYEAKQDYDKAFDQYQIAIKIDPSYGNAYLGAANSEYARGNVSQAIENFQKAIAADKSLTESYYNLANLYLDQLNYSAALEYYNKTLEVNADYVYAQHNKAWIYEKLGQYKTSKDEWMKAKDAYAKVLAGKKSGRIDPDTAAKYFYYANILNNYLEETHSDYDATKIIDHYKHAIDADNTAPYYRCALLKFYKEQRIELESQKQKTNSTDKLDEKNTLQKKIDEYYMSSKDQYREGVGFLKKKLEVKKDKWDLNDLGEFYLAMEEYEEAANVYEEAIKLDDKYSRSYVGYGVAQSKLNNYTEAIKHFKKALLLDPDDLNVQSNLADAYLKSEKLSLAEECYKNILNVAPCHVDALIGLAEHHKLLADEMAEDKKYSDAEELLKQAAKLYDDILDKTKDFKSVSRKLNSQEISSINYSVGYIKVKLYEIDEGLGFRALTRFGKSSDLQYALKSFKKITQEQPDFYKAQTAIKKINKQFSLTVSVRRKIAPSMVFLISLLICLAAQFFFWIGRPKNKDQFLVNNASLSGFISQNNLGFFTGGLAQVATKKFNSLKELQEDVRKTISGNDSIMHKLEQLPTVQISEVDYEPIDSTIYISLTFGTLIFMVVGLYLGNISKLKVGAIELEKTTADTISTSPNLGIGR